MVEYIIEEVERSRFESIEIINFVGEEESGSL